MRITILVPSAKYPRGGTTALYEFANALRRRGHEICLVHVDFIGTWSDRAVVIDSPIDRVEDVTWCRFEEGIDHRIGVGAESDLPPADVINYYSPTLPEDAGKPFVFLQGNRVLPRRVEEWVFATPCPKVCVASWLVRVARQRGVRDKRLALVHCGLDHDKYRILVPAHDRPPSVAMCYGTDHKRGAAGFEALEMVKARFPRLQAVVFGTSDPIQRIPEWMTFHRAPPQRVIVEEIYNRSRVFLNPSMIEGFGLTSIEAMACGCALVTVPNLGSEDFAIDGVTAAVSEGRGPAKLAARVCELFDDDDERLRLSAGGARFVRRFDWDESARRLETFLSAYAAHPGAYL
jgi:L-malate glycosyltransferase